MEDQISALAPEKREQLKEVDNAKMRQVAQLLRLPGIGPVSSWTFVMEFFGWRQFRKRQEVAALAGLTPTPLRQWQTVPRAGD
jgi:transposase